MKIEIKIDSTIKEDKVVIYVKEITEAVQKIVKQLENETLDVITGINEEKIYILKPSEINYFYSENQKY